MPGRRNTNAKTTVIVIKKMNFIRIFTLSIKALS
jgi:hypothetical protein